MAAKSVNPWDKDYGGSKSTPIYESLWSMLQQVLHRTPVKTILDFGCGDGAYSVLMSKEGLTVAGIDISAKAIEKARSNNNGNSDGNCSFIRHDSIPESIPDGSFDAVVMLNSLHCLTRKERSAVLGQAKRVLKQDGWLFISALSLEAESYPRQEWKEIEANTYNDGTGKIFHFFSYNELRSELRGLEIVESTTLQNIHPEVGRKSALFIVTAKKQEGAKHARHD